MMKSPLGKACNYQREVVVCFGIRRDLGSESIGVETFASVVVLANFTYSHDGDFVLIDIIVINMMKR